jgi:3-methyladenine DNA glycosylase AlkC
VEPFKNNVGPDAVRNISAAFGGLPAFETTVLESLESLELKARIALVARSLWAALDAPMSLVGPRLVQASTQLGMWETWPLCSVVEFFGVTDFDASFAAMHDLTSVASCEFAVRPFLRDDEARALATLTEWTTDPDEHVRRLVSEGTRSRLPWGGRLRRFATDPTAPLALLETLRHDPAKYVRLSVANHLGDIAKDHPIRANQVARRWWNEGDDNLRWVVRHGLRGPIKAGDPDSLDILGYGPPKVDVGRFVVSPSTVAYPGELTIEVELTARADQKLLIDYAVHHVKANGKTSPKVFKWTTATVTRGRTFARTKRHAIKPISTRVYRPGEHAVELLINGTSLGRVPFVLTF